MKLFYPNHYKSGLAVALLMLFSSFTSWGQEPNFKNYNTANGLPSNQVYDMYQDAKGVMWFATDRGISKFNGYTFKNFGLKDGLTSTTVFKFYPQKNGDVWCSTINNEFFFFNPSDEIFHPYAYNKSLVRLSYGDTNADFCIDSLDNKHFSFISWNGVITIDKLGNVVNGNSKRLEFSNPELILADLGDNRSIYFSYTAGAPSIFKDEIRIPVKSANYHKEAHSGNLILFSGMNDVYLLKDGSLKATVNKGKMVIGLGMFDESHFWVGFERGGFGIYDFSGNETNSYFSDKSVSIVHHDHENGLWISTLFSGVFYTPDIRVFSYFVSSDITISELSSTKNNQLVVGFHSGEMLWKIGDNFVPYFLPSTDRISLHQYYSGVDASLHYRDGRVLFESANGLSSESKIMFCRKFSDETDQIPLIASTQCIGIVSGDKIQKFVVTGRVNDVCQLRDEFYFSTNNGFFSYDTIHKVEQKIGNKYLDCRVGDIDKFRNSLLIATTGRGLVWWEKDEFRAITKKEGLMGDLISEVYVQNDSVVWVCTNAGLSRIKFDQGNGYHINTITTANGLLDNDVTDVEIINDIVWVSTRKGMCSFPISFINETKTIKDFFLQLTGTKVNGIQTSDFSNLIHTENRLEFNFQAISFKNNNSLRYRYRLKGLENKWNYTQNLQAVYQAIPPGSYMFILQVGVGDSWSKEIIKRSLTIHPPFYKTGWFIALVVATILFMIYLFFRFRILSYNRDIIREVLRQLLKRIRRKSVEFTVRSQGRDIKLNSDEVLFVQSLGNYLEIYTADDKVVIRERISNFVKLVPDSVEYLQIHRSYIVRIDQVTEVGVDTLKVGSTEMSIGNTYKDAVSQIQV